MSLERRLSKLEEAGGCGLFIIHAYEDEDPEAVFERTYPGVTPRPDDLIVMLIKFCRPEDKSAGAQMAESKP